ncbi:MAG: hypothetical protein D6706_18495 [Chloroflexi bacterium]|nr:MAG: hypothetical protein D6706_18495 [Chloroflexota bacterium]
MSLRVIFTLFDEQKYENDPREHVIRAYPGNIPDWAEECWLHCGDWAARTGRLFDDLESLARWYQERGGVVCLAPNARQRPEQTMDLWKRWHEAGYGTVVPILECRRGLNDLDSIMTQAEFYNQWDDWKEHGLICLANPLENSHNVAGKVVLACNLIRGILGDDIKIHVLGAGWDTNDIQGWAELGCVDSIDSTAYYEDAKAGLRWQSRGVEPIYDDKTPWRELALHNARMALEAARWGDNFRKQTGFWRGKKG